jgi:hypothetical protein
LPRGLSDILISEFEELRETVMIELVDVYHSDDTKPQPPFLLVRAGERNLPAPKTEKWTFWKRVPINIVAVDQEQAEQLITQQGYYLQ